MSAWRTLWRRGSKEAELDAELRFHVEQQLQDYVDAGVPPAEARRRVRVEFGDINVAKEECRDVRPLHWLADLATDVRIGIRTLARERLFATSVIGILALGIGATVAMFSVLHAVVLRPLPYARPGELVTLSTLHIAQNQWDGTSVPNFLDWREQGTSFAGMTCYRRTQVSQVTFAGVEAPQRAQEGLVGPGFFELLGTPALIGTTFSREQFERAERVVVLSQGLWEEQFGGSTNVLGRTLSIDGREHAIVGVMPRSFQLPTRDTRLWRPLPVAHAWGTAVTSARDGDSVEVIGRLRPGARVEDATTEMSVVAARLREAHAVNRNLDVRVVPLFDHVVGTRTRRSVWLGFAAVLMLLAVACTNAGGLLAARAARRRHEFAVRSALGAGRARLVRQFLAEGVSLWAAASSAGALVAYASMQLVLAYGPRGLPRLEEVRLDPLGLTVALVGGLAVVLVAGSVPALVAARAAAPTAFGVRNLSSLPGRRAHDLLVTGQIAGALLLLIGAMLFAQSFLRAQQEDPGYAAQHLLVVRIERPSVPTFFGEAQERIGRLPGVVAVGGIKQFFLRRNADQRVTVEGRQAAAGETHPRLAVDAVTPGYFRSMGIELLEGRDFEARDLESAARVSIVNDTMARRFWPGESAAGKRWIGGGSAPKDGRWNTIVGVVRDMRREGLDLAPIAAAFVPDLFSGNFDMTIRATTNAITLIPAVRSEIRSIDRSLPIPEISAANRHLAERLGGRRFETQLLVAFAAVALLLSGAGLYASLAYQVALRTREIGIRSVLGARRRSIVAMIVGQGLRLAVAGAVLGVIAAASSAKVMHSLLYETPAVDTTSYAAAVVFVLLVAAAAAWIPAHRAAAVSPMAALRQD